MADKIFDARAKNEHPQSADFFYVTIANVGRRFSAPDAMTLLDAARVAGITLPSSCRNGTCRTCRCLMRSGSVRYQIAWPGLSPAEKDEGLVLPCVAYPLTDIVLEQPSARINDGDNTVPSCESLY